MCRSDPLVVAGMKRRKAGTVPAIRRECDQLWSRAVHERAGDRCELCGGNPHSAHHIFTRGSSLATRWDLDNGICLCIRCHYAVHSGNLSTEYQALIRDVVGDDRFERIRRKHRTKVTLRKADFEQIRDGLRQATGTFAEMC